MWQSKQLPPVITVQQQFHSKVSNFKIIRPLYVFSLEIDKGDEETFRIQDKGDIFQYHIGSYNTGGVNLTKNTPKFLCSQQNRTLVYYYDPICINLQDEGQTNLFQNYQNRTQDTYVNTSIDYCDPRLFNNCLSFQDQYKLFYFTSPSWRLTLITQEVNLKNGNVTDIPQDHFFNALPYQNTSTLSIQLRFRKGTYIIDDGILFPNLRVIEIVRSIELFTHTPQYNDYNNVLMIAYINYHLDRNEEIITVTYPKVGQILADLGSIIQILLLFGLVMNQFNHTQMQIKIEKMLLEIYFPEIKLFDFKYNWKGQIQSISQMGKLLKEFDYERMKIFRITTGYLLRSKLNYLNILHEISRVQIQLQLKTPRSDSFQYQSLGYRLKLPYQISNQRSNAQGQDRILDHRDFQILCLQKHKQDDTDYLNNITPIHDKQNMVESFGLNEQPVTIFQNQTNIDLLNSNQKAEQLLLNLQLGPRINAQISSHETDFMIANDITEQRFQRKPDQDSQIFDHNYEIPDDQNFSDRVVRQQNMNIQNKIRLKQMKNKITPFLQQTKSKKLNQTL